MDQLMWLFFFWKDAQQTMIIYDWKEEKKKHDTQPGIESTSLVNLDHRIERAERVRKSTE